MDLLRSKGFGYSFDPAACRECGGTCCKGRPGHIWVSVVEIEQIAAFLQTSLVDIIDQYLARVDNRLSIRERYIEGHHECIFFETAERRCLIYDARPDQCRRFPFWTYFRGRENELLEECPGVRMDE